MLDPSKGGVDAGGYHCGMDIHTSTGSYGSDFGSTPWD